MERKRNQRPIQQLRKLGSAENTVITPEEYWADYPSVVKRIKDNRETVLKNIQRQNAYDTSNDEKIAEFSLFQNNVASDPINDNKEKESVHAEVKEQINEEKTITVIPVPKPKITSSVVSTPAIVETIRLKYKLCEDLWCTANNPCENCENMRNFEEDTEEVYLTSGYVGDMKKFGLDDDY